MEESRVEVYLEEEDGLIIALMDLDEDCQVEVCSVDTEAYTKSDDIKAIFMRLVVEAVQVAVEEMEEFSESYSINVNPLIQASGTVH